MTHPETSEQLSAYLDGELTEAERAELEGQLQSDPSLRAELERLRDAVTFLRTHGPVQAPADFRDKVLAAVANEPMPGGWWRWLRRPFGLPVEGLAVALAAALVLLVALPLSLTSGDEAKDLAGDPLGFVRGEEVRSAPAAADLKSKQEVAQKGGEVPEGTAAPSSRPDSKVAARPAPSPSAPDAWEPKQTGTASSSQANAAPSATPSAPAGTSGDAVADIEGADEPSADSYAQAPAAPMGLYAYAILTPDSEALAKLQRIAARYKGRVLDSRGRFVDTTDLQPGETYQVEIPSSALAAFGDDLRTLGMVTESLDDSRLVGGTVRVQVRFDLVPDQGQDAAKPTRSYQQSAE